ncbi:hypothetical protein [Lysobacter sp. Root690]|uniref:hypothetical protein n=1 Tax=Lysobacter sp. Root690 TaxID=1736588 RepID=UPI0012FC56D4|nr:hypothetical protein [Lysobacter sp. Root690]
MDLTGRTLWQVGSGDAFRSYGDLCIKHDVMILGPGNPGRFESARYKDHGHVRRFCKDVRRGDLVLLRHKTGDILAAGVVADDEAFWSESFADIDGWDLQHVRRVHWLPNSNKRFGARTFGGQGNRFAMMNIEKVRQWVSDLPLSANFVARPLAPLPEVGRDLNLDELGRLLFIEGLASEYIDKLTSTFASLQRVAAWYANEEKRPEKRPSEMETICYLIVPFLLSLGWSQQTAAIQWNYVDIALFRSMPPTDASLDCVIEAKLLGRSVFSAEGQARLYALKKGRGDCKRLIVTDGIRYALYARNTDDFVLTAYLNILSMRDAYPVLNCGGAVEVVMGIARQG